MRVAKGREKRALDGVGYKGSIEGADFLAESWRRSRWVIQQGEAGAHKLDRMSYFGETYSISKQCYIRRPHYPVS